MALREWIHESVASPTRVERALTATIMRGLGSPPARVELWDAKPAYTPSTRACSTVRFSDRESLWQFLARPEVGFCRGYVQGRIDVSGDLAATLAASFRHARECRDGRNGRNGRSKRVRPLVPGQRLLPNLPNGHRRARQNASNHYDLGNEFYARWLDEDMVYTCAYFDGDDVGLERAQRAKLELVCRKLGLRPGQEVLELGSGWGSFALYAAERYGVRVRAFNVAREQIAFARARARRKGLEQRVEFIDDDYRNATGRCDALVSIGMLEHVGPASYPQLRRVIARTLRPDGRGLLHFIGRARSQPLNAWLEREVFPGARPPALTQVLEILEPIDLAVLDVENLRAHYALTLEHWLERFEANQPELEDMVGRDKTRAFHLYLVGTLAAFRAGTVQLFQVSFAPAANLTTPLTRHELYARPAALKPAPWFAATS